MRISDWSSDVCSSDLGIDIAGEQRGDTPGITFDHLLGDACPGLFRTPVAVIAVDHQMVAVYPFDQLVGARADDRLARVEILGDGRGKFLLHAEDPGHELGRASCRERVCHYVSIEVVVVTLTKHIHYNLLNLS